MVARCGSGTAGFLGDVLAGGRRRMAGTLLGTVINGRRGADASPCYAKADPESRHKPLSWFAV